MTQMLSRAISTLLAASAIAACGSSPSTPADGARIDAGRPDARPDGSPPVDTPPPIDAPDAPPPIDMDHDGHPAEADCDDNNPAVWQNLAYSFRDADGDTHTVASAGTICSGDTLPPGYFTTAAGEPDCDDSDPAIFASVVGFLDSDGDRVGDGPAVPFCTAGSPPDGYAEVSGDCAPGDAARWVDRPYSFRDADGDGAAIAETGTVCSGDALPPGYLAAAPGQPVDCDDHDPSVSLALTIFADGDGDHVGAGTGQVACTNGTPPAGFETTGTDCDDGDPSIFVARVYTAVDRDGDTFTAPEMGVRCTAGTLSPPFFDTAQGNDCDDHDDSVWALLGYQGIDDDGDGFTIASSGSVCTDGTLPPRFVTALHGNDCNDHDPDLIRWAVLYHDGDGDGVGAPPRQVLCLGPLNPAGFVAGGYDEDDGDPAVIETDDFDELLDLIVLGG